MSIMNHNHLPVTKAAGKAFMQACYFLEVLDLKSEEDNLELLQASVQLIQEVQRLEQLPFQEALPKHAELESTEYKMYEQ